MDRNSHLTCQCAGTVTAGPSTSEAHGEGGDRLNLMISSQLYVLSGLVVKKATRRPPSPVMLRVPVTANAHIDIDTMNLLHVVLPLVPVSFFLP